MMAAYLKSNINKPYFLGLLLLLSTLHFLWYRFFPIYFVCVGLFTLIYLVKTLRKTWPSYLKDQDNLLLYAKMSFFVSLLFWLVNGYLKILGLKFGWYDMGIYASVVNSITKNGTFYNSLLGMNEFGDHFSPILFLFVPLFKIIPTVLWLYWTKIAAHFYAIWRIYRFAEHQRINTLLLCMILFIGSTHEIISSALKFEFSPSALALPLVVLIYEMCFRKQFFQACIMLVILLLFKESMVLVWISVGLYLILIEKRWLFGSLIILSGIIVGILIVTQLMPLFNHGSVHHTNSISLLEQLPEKAFSLFSLVVLLVPIILLNPIYVLVFLPLMGLIFLGSDSKPTMATLEYHYHDIAYIGLAMLGIMAYLNPTPFIKLQMIKFRIIGVVLLGYVLISSDHFPSIDNLDFNFAKSAEIRHDALTLNHFIENNLAAQEIIVQQELCPYFINLSFPKSASILTQNEKTIKRPIVFYNETNYKNSRDSVVSLIKRHTFKEIKFGKLTLYF